MCARGANSALIKCTHIDLYTEYTKHTVGILECNTKHNAIDDERCVYK